jgi:hypothetical protein
MLRLGPGTHPPCGRHPWDRDQLGLGTWFPWSYYNLSGTNFAPRGEFFSGDRVDPWDERVERDLDVVVAAVLEVHAGLRDSGLADLLPAVLPRGGDVGDLVDGFVLHGLNIPFLRRTLHWVPPV